MQKEQEVPGRTTDLDRHPVPAAAPHSTARGRIDLPAQRPSLEESTMSPPPASPIKEDDPCRIDVTNVAVDSVMLLICLCGLAGNGVVLWLLSFRICRNPITNYINPITIYILTMAVADFAFLLLMVPSTLLFLLGDRSCSTVVPPNYLRFLFQLSLFSYNLGPCLLAAITIERCSSIPCLLRCRCRFPKCLSNMVSVMLKVISSAVTVAVDFMCASVDYEFFKEFLITINALNLLLFGPSLVISSTIFFTKFKCGFQQQQIKRIDIVISLTVLLTLPLSLWNFLQEFGYKSVSQQFVFLLTCIHSTSKPFIYFSVGSCWRNCSMGSLRDSLQRVFEEPEENTSSSNDAAMDTAV